MRGRRAVTTRTVFLNRENETGGRKQADIYAECRSVLGAQQRW